MKERPILFSGPMVRAIISGQKTVTRRVVKPQFQTAPVDVVDGVPSWDSPTNYAGEVQMNTQHGKPCPYGKPGDRLWVRETFYAFGRWITRFSEKKGRDEWHFVDMTLECGHAYIYDADSPTLQLASDRGSMTPGWYKRPAIFMPRAASRILPDITDVRVERLQEITVDQVLDEGIGDHRFECDRPVEPDGYPACSCGSVGYVDSFADLWNSVNGKGAWDANPWVWVVEFKRIEP